ncbi:MAG: hypothetical protein AAGA09_09415, partial [Pseudomonadota bacterium]
QSAPSKIRRTAHPDRSDDLPSSNRSIAEINFRESRFVGKTETFFNTIGHKQSLYSARLLLHFMEIQSGILSKKQPAK